MQLDVDDWEAHMGSRAVALHWGGICGRIEWSEDVLRASTKGMF